MTESEFADTTVAADASRRGPDAVPLAGGEGRRPSGIAVFVLLAGLALTAVLALISHSLYNENENRLLALRAREVGSVVEARVPVIQTPLASAAALADATSGSAARFRGFMAAYVGPGKQFVSASLWRLGAGAPSTELGPQPEIASQPARARAFFARAERSPQLEVIGLLQGPSPGIGYEFNTPGGHSGFAAYAETRLPTDRESKLASSSAFSDLDYVLYLGRTQNPGDLLVTSIHRFPVTGRHASTEVPFGDDAFTLVVIPRGPLAGTFFRDLPWLLAIAGTLITIAAALLTDRLARRRRHAERLSAILDDVAAENHRLYNEQRGIAQTLQHALLPDSLPELRGLSAAALYVPASSGIEVGGDWYDLIEVPGGAMVVIGDVSGHGLRAATTMASLRHATLAYAAQERSPGRVLDRLSAFVDGGEHHYFATVLCALIDVDARRVTVASAGHFAPLLITRSGARYADVAAGLPIGVHGEGEYREHSFSVEQGGTLVAFTDGLVERRGEVIDAGLERLRASADGRDGPLGEMLSGLVGDLAHDHVPDDTAIIGLQWQL